MNKDKVTSFKGQRLELAMSVRFFTQDEAKKMSKYRVIQKNLVHIQGFPDSIADNLEQFEYLGQFGKIIKLVVVKGKDEDFQPQLKKSNSAYITYSTNEEAANSILAVDSFTFDTHLIRAFFGTSKYCIHFLNNKECYNKAKCMYLHCLASEEDVLGNTCGTYSKYDYSEHLQIALMISGVLSKGKKESILKMKFPKTIFPNLKSIYSKDFVIQTEKKQLEFIGSSALASSSSKTSAFNTPISNDISNCNTNKGSPRTSFNDDDTISKGSGKLSDNTLEQDAVLYRYRTQSRFFNEIRNNNADLPVVPLYVIELVDKLSSRFSFFKQFNQTNNEYELKNQQEYLFNDSWSEFNNVNEKLLLPDDNDADGNNANANVNVNVNADINDNSNNANAQESNNKP